jgi:hypothetical protein
MSTILVIACVLLIEFAVHCVVYWKLSLNLTLADMLPSFVFSSIGVLLGILASRLIEANKYVMVIIFVLLARFLLSLIFRYFRLQDDRFDK